MMQAPEGIEGYRRYAVYWAPPSHSALAQAGAQWLGWDAEARTACTPGDDRAEALTREPRRYGFHATLKPPFALAPGHGAGELDAALAGLAAECAPVEAPGLAVAPMSGFIALRPAGPCPALDALAARCVTALDRFRAPPTPEEIARRRPDSLSPEGRENLMRWGYPHVMGAFRFHLTLTGRLPPDEARAMASQLAARFAPHLPPRLRIEALCLFGDPGGGAPFHLLRRHDLTG